MFGMLVALSNAIAKKQGLPIVERVGCKGCPSRDVCEKLENCDDAIKEGVKDE